MPTITEKPDGARPGRPYLSSTLAAGLLCLLAATGCGLDGGSEVPPVDAAAARTTLSSVLDAWQAGKTPDSFAQQSPPIRVADEDWLGGLPLVSNAADPKDRGGGALSCPVDLVLKNKAGKNIKKRVYCNVTAAPSPSVIRQD